MEPMEEQTTRIGEEAEEAAEDRTFTQAELDEIVRKRLARERDKMSLIANGTFEQKLLEREKAVSEKEFKAVARERLIEAKLPAGAAEFINCSGEEAFEGSYTGMVKLLGPMVEEAVAAQTEERFRQSGRTPAQGGSGSNPIKDAVRSAFQK